MNPEEYQERILLTVTGLSPQVVTETLYALQDRKDNQFIPTRIVVITTEEGANRVRLELLSDGNNWIGKLCKEYGLATIKFDNSDIYVIKDEAGNPLPDIRKPEHNSMVADQISETVRELTSNDDCAIHASLAGGRKTMGFYLGYTMSLYGRPQDRLSHVLVDAGYESSSDFYYPTKEKKVIYDYTGRPMDVSKAGVTLADIPFVRLRDGLTEKLQRGGSSFSETIEAAQRLYEPTTLKIITREGKILCNGVAVKMSRAEMAYYLFMVLRTVEGKAPVHWKDEGWRSEYLAAYKEVASDWSAEYEQAENALNGNDEEDDKKYFEQRKSRSNKAIKEELGVRLAEPFLVQTLGKRGYSRYGITLSPEVIEII